MIDEEYVNEILINKVEMYREYMADGDMLDNLIGKIVIAEITEIAKELGLHEI